MNDTIKQLVQQSGGQKETARLLYVTQPTISRWVNGKCDPPQATLALARILLQLGQPTNDSRKT